jgi:hypothetical protein
MLLIQSGIVLHLQIALCLSSCDLLMFGTCVSYCVSIGLVLGAGIEPALHFGEQDFKSCVSTYSTTRAYISLY